MEEIRIARSHGPELVFQGVCITTARNGPEGRLAMGRWHDISVYRRADDAWLASIDYHTQYADEKDHSEVEIIDDPSELESVLLSYEPWEHVDRRVLARLSGDGRQRLSSRLWANYLDLVNRVLDNVAEHLPTPQSRTSNE